MQFSTLVIIRIYLFIFWAERHIIMVSERWHVTHWSTFQKHIWIEAAILNSHSISQYLLFCHFFFFLYSRVHKSINKTWTHSNYQPLLYYITTYILAQNIPLFLSVSPPLFLSCIFLLTYNRIHSSAFPFSSKVKRKSL